MSHGGGGLCNLKYALIGMRQFGFNLNIAKARKSSLKMLKYFLCFGDLHNFHTPAEEYESLLSKKFTNGGYMTDDALELNDPYSELTDHEMDIQDHLNVRGDADNWKGRRYPLTIAENKKILDDYLALCETNNVKPILFLPPASIGYKEFFPKDSLDEFYFVLNDEMKKHSTAVFFDGWKIEGFEDTHLFWDATHINVKGAAKFTPILNDFVMQFERK